MRVQEKMRHQMDKTATMKKAMRKKTMRKHLQRIKRTIQMRRRMPFRQKSHQVPRSKQRPR